MILRKAMSRYVPAEIVDATKQGFSSPDASWFKGESLEYVKEMLYSSRTRLNEFFDPAIVRELLQEDDIRVKRTDNNHSNAFL